MTKDRGQGGMDRRWEEVEGDSVGEGRRQTLESKQGKGDKDMVRQGRASPRATEPSLKFFGLGTDMASVSRDSSEINVKDVSL